MSPLQHTETQFFLKYFSINNYTKPKLFVQASQHMQNSNKTYTNQNAQPSKKNPVDKFLKLS